MIALVLTARSSWTKYQTVLEALIDQRAPVVLFACGQALLPEYGRVVDVVRAQFPQLDIREVWSHLDGNEPVSSAKSAAILLNDLAGQFAQLTPKCVVVMADRSEVLAAAQAASYLNIPLVHLQGGEQTGSIDDRCRDAITHLANHHYVATHLAGLRVGALTAYQDTIAVTGCPSIDLASRALLGPPVTAQELSGAGSDVDPQQPFVLVLQHADTTVWQEAYGQMTQTLEALRDVRLPIIVQWPNADPGSEGIQKAIRVFRDQHPQTALRTIPNLPPERFLRLLTQARCLVGNSSVGIRECSWLGVPVVNVGDRQARRERGPNVIDVGYDSAQIGQAVQTYRQFSRHGLYGDGHAGKRIADLLVQL